MDFGYLTSCLWTIKFRQEAAIIPNSTRMSLLFNARGSSAVMTKYNWTTETADFQECQTVEHDIHRLLLLYMRTALYKHPFATSVVVLERFSDYSVPLGFLTLFRDCRPEFRLKIWTREVSKPLRK